ncbi:hypothetical protein RAS1_09260 [Phycisphaerae bacterium RAS1]|nr:hypothetical protein RAS1_09260 [Phycisphaerae bacterium RAS1]
MSGERVLGADGGRVVMTTADGGQGVADGSAACCPACVDYIDIGGGVTLPGRHRRADVANIVDINLPPHYVQVHRYSGDENSAHWFVPQTSFPIQYLGGQRTFRFVRGAPPQTPPIQLPPGQAWGADSAYAWEEFDIGVLPKIWERLPLVNCGDVQCYTPPPPPFTFYYCFVQTLCYHEWPPCGSDLGEWQSGTWDDATWHAPWAVSVEGEFPSTLAEWLTHVQWVGTARVYFGRVAFAAEDSWDAEHLFPPGGGAPPLYCWVVIDVPTRSESRVGEVNPVLVSLGDCPLGTFQCAANRYDHLPTTTIAEIGYQNTAYVADQPAAVFGDGVGGVSATYESSADAAPQASTHETRIIEQTTCVCDDDDDGPPPNPDPDIPPPQPPDDPPPGVQPPDPCDELIGGDARCECYRRRARCANPPDCGGPFQPRCCRPDIVPPDCIPGQQVAYRGTGECETTVSMLDYFVVPLCGIVVRDRVRP